MWLICSRLWWDVWLLEQATSYLNELMQVHPPTSKLHARFVLFLRTLPWVSASTWANACGNLTGLRGWVLGCFSFLLSRVESRWVFCVIFHVGPLRDFPLQSTKLRFVAAALALAANFSLAVLILQPPWTPTWPCTDARRSLLISPGMGIGMEVDFLAPHCTLQVAWGLNYLDGLASPKGEARKLRSPSPYVGTMSDTALSRTSRIQVVAGPFKPNVGTLLQVHIHMLLIWGIIGFPHNIVNSSKPFWYKWCNGMRWLIPASVYSMTVLFCWWGGGNQACEAMSWVIRTFLIGFSDFLHPLLLVCKGPMPLMEAFWGPFIWGPAPWNTRFRTLHFRARTQTKRKRLRAPRFRRLRTRGEHSDSRTYGKSTS